jgi:hypothetical protein
VTWHWELSRSLVVDDVAAGMCAVRQEGRQGRCRVTWQGYGGAGGSNGAVTWQWLQSKGGGQRQRRVVGCDVAVPGRAGVDELAPGWPKCGC